MVGVARFCQIKTFLAIPITFIASTEFLFLSFKAVMVTVESNSKIITNKIKLTFFHLKKCQSKSVTFGDFYFVYQHQQFTNLADCLYVKYTDFY